MPHTPGVETIPLTPIESQRRLETHQAFILVSLLFGTVVSFTLAIVLPLGRALGWGLEASRPDLIHVHGQAQVLGFAGLFVMGMALRLMPRFSGVHLRYPQLVFPTLGLITAGLLIRAFIATPLPETAQGIVTAGAQLSILAGVSCFALMVYATLGQKGSRADATGYMFMVGSGFLVAHALLALFVAVDGVRDGMRVLPYLPSQAVIHFQLIGFLIAFIAGVGTRAIPTMVGLPRPITSVKALAGVLGLAVSMTTAALLWAEYVDYSPAVARFASFGYLVLGPVFIATAWLSGVFRPAANRLRPASQSHVWLLRTAMAWLTVAGVLAAYYGTRSLLDGVMVGQFEIDAIRHALGVGVVTALIMGMALMIVPEFAGQRQSVDQRWLSLTLALLINAAVVLRVAPAIAGFDWSADARDWSMTAAGVFAQAAILLFAVSFARLFLSQRQLLIRPN
jgi:uncharacterized protein involved in response to NO